MVLAGAMNGRADRDKPLSDFSARQRKAKQRSDAANVEIDLAMRCRFRLDVADWCQLAPASQPADELGGAR